MKNIFFVAALILTLISSEAKAEEPPSSWSLDINSGITSGYFTFNSKATAHGGINVRYSMNPLVSFYGNLGAGTFRSTDPMDGRNGFSNDYFAIGVGTRMNILRMLTGINPVTENFGFYASTGIGLMRGDVRVSNVSLPGYAGRNNPVNAVIYRIATGATYRINRRVDLFVQTEFNHSNSDLLDGYERISGGGRTGRFSGGDSFINTNVGITVKLGRRNVRHVDWYQWDHQSDPMVSSLEMEVMRLQNELERRDRVKEQLGQRLLSLNETLNDFNYLINTAHKEQFMAYDDQIQNLQSRMEILQTDLDEITKQTDVQRPVQDPERFLVVAGVFRNPDNAERMLRELRNTGYTRAGIETDYRQYYYLVSYGAFPTREQATRELQRIRAEVNPESWIYVK